MDNDLESLREKKLRDKYFGDAALSLEEMEAELEFINTFGMDGF